MNIPPNSVFLFKLLIFIDLNLILQVGKKIGTGEGQVLGI
jgi:hypothetical protein|tara:strand:+ start:542 stop:661 length:120 start_codon:yes stop_codon:yes gene_type:complete